MTQTISLADAQAQVAAWRDASLALANGKTFSMNGRTLTRADAAEVREQINYWSKIEAELLARAAGRNRIGVSYGLAKFR